MNNIQLLPLYSSVILFADDTTIFNSHKSQKFLKYSLEHDLNLMIDWFKANKLSLNLSKMIGIKFWDNNTNMTLNVDNMNIQMTECTKFLGVYIDYKLAWHIHVNHLLDTLNTNRRMLCLGKKLLDTTCMRSIYYGHIHSHILYGISMWGSMISQSKINEIFKIQKQCVRILDHRNQGYDMIKHFRDLHIIPIDDMIQVAMCKLGHNISHKHIPTLIIQLFDKFGGRKQHRYSTHNKHIPNIQLHHSERYKKSFLCQSISEFNNLPMELKQIVNINNFLMKIKKVYHLILSTHHH